MKLWHGILAILIGFVIGLCVQKSPEIEQITQYDTTYVPKPYAVYYTDTVRIIDTVEVIKEFYAEKHYYDTIKIKHVELFINEIVTQNDIIFRNIGYKINKQKPYVSLGMSTIYNNFGLQIYPTMTYNADKYSLTAGYNPINKGVYFGASFKIFNL